MHRAVVFAVLLMGCRQNDDPEGARSLYAKVNEGAGFRAWRRAPEFPTRKPSFTAHSREVEIFVNEPMAKAIDGVDPPKARVEDPSIREWPVGSIVVKEGFSGDARAIVAIMEKRESGWYWTELDGDGEPLWSAANGQPEICIECHDNRAKYSDWVYSVELPR